MKDAVMSEDVTWYYESYIFFGLIDSDLMSFYLITIVIYNIINYQQDILICLIVYYC